MKIKSNWRDHRWCLLGALKHGFQHLLFVVLGPGAHLQLCDLDGRVVNDSNLATAYILVLTKLLDGAVEVLEWRDLLHRKVLEWTHLLHRQVLEWSDLLHRQVLEWRDLLQTSSWLKGSAKSSWMKGFVTRTSSWVKWCYTKKFWNDGICKSYTDKLLNERIYYTDKFLNEGIC